MLIYAVDDEGITLEVRIEYVDASVKINAKIDTGATYSIFERRFGEALGLQIENGIRQRFGTATGGFYAYGFRVSLTVADFAVDSMVFFTENADFNKNVVGRIGWLDQVIIGLNDSEGKLYLSKYGAE